MKKTLRSGFACLLALVFVSSGAYAWNFATHAYIAGKLGKLLPLANANEMYGIMLPDLFNLDFSLMGDTTLRGYTHGIPGVSENFMQVWYNANWGLKKNIAWGFVAHNDVWGMDFVAHWQANPFSPGPDIPFPLGVPDPTSQPPGYIIKLAQFLDNGLATNPMGNVWQLLGIEDNYPIRLELCHNLIEYAGDFIIKRADPMIGQKLIGAALLRTPQVTSLLKAAFPPEYAPLIDAAEPEYRKMLIQYGLILMTPEQTAINLLSEQLADLAIAYLGSDYEAYRSVLVEFGKSALAASVQICQDAGYMDEINLMTLPYVKQQLLLHGIFYWF